jgi:hypothetical protein
LAIADDASMGADAVKGVAGAASDIGVDIDAYIDTDELGSEEGKGVGAEEGKGVGAEEGKRTCCRDCSECTGPSLSLAASNDIINDGRDDCKGRDAGCKGRGAG